MFGFGKFNLNDGFKFNPAPLPDLGGVADLDVSKNPVSTGEVASRIPDAFLNAGSGGSGLSLGTVDLGFSGSFSGSGSVNGSLSGGVGDNGDTFSNLSFSFDDFLF